MGLEDLEQGPLSLPAEVAGPQRSWHLAGISCEDGHAVISRRDLGRLGVWQDVPLWWRSRDDPKMIPQGAYGRLTVWVGVHAAVQQGRIHEFRESLAWNGTRASLRPSRSTPAAPMSAGRSGANAVGEKLAHFKAVPPGASASPQHAGVDRADRVDPVP